MKKFFGILFAVVAWPFLLYLLIVSIRFVFYGLEVDNGFKPLVAIFIGGLGALISACCFSDHWRDL